MTLSVARKIFFLCGYGLTDAQIAQVLGISEAVINKAKEQSEFMESVARIKGEIDLKVQNALYKRALGMTVTERKVGTDRGEQTNLVIQKELPPDVGACQLWLHNRDRTNWRSEKEKPEGLESRKPSLIRIFTPAHTGELTVIQRGENQTDVLFGDGFTEKIKGKDGNSDAPRV